MRLQTRPRLIPALVLPAAVVAATLMPLSEDASAASVSPAVPPTAATTPAEPGDDTDGEHRSVPLDASAPAQTQRWLPGTDGGAELDATPEGQTSTAALTLDEGVHVLGLRWEGPHPEVAELRLREPTGSWGAWSPLEDPVPAAPAPVEHLAQDAIGPGDSEAPVDDADEAVRATTGDVVIGPAEVQVRLVGEASDPTLEIWTTQRTASDASTVRELPVSDDQLAIGTRADWGADETMPRVWEPRELVNDFPKLGVTVHHTAGFNDYAAVDVPAIIRGIFYYHGQTLKWDDIGYASVVDKYGRVWEGRAGGVEENIQLAHAFGMNRDWTGVAVLGNHQTAQVWATELTALSRLTAWNLDTHGVTPGSTVTYENSYEGWTRTLDVVHGHRDVGQTLCPGHELYILMDWLRDMVATHHAEGTDAVQRIGGGDRYAVAAGVARRAFMEGTDTAYLASGMHVADALGVGPVADAAGAAVLLTKPDSVPAETMAALTFLGVREVVLVGGTDAISQDVVDRLTQAQLTVRRVEGPDRFATAAALTAERPSTGGTVYVADGLGLADALGGAAAAAEQDGVLLLTQPTSLPMVTYSTLRSLAPSRVVVLGGESAVSEPVRQQIADALPGAVVDRVGGTNRYATSGLLATDAFDTASSAVVANGNAAVDAVVGTQLAARHDGPVLLTRSDCRPRSVDTAYDELGTSLSRLAGGPDVLAWSAGNTVCG